MLKAVPDSTGKSTPRSAAEHHEGSSSRPSRLSSNSVLGKRPSPLNTPADRPAQRQSSITEPEEDLLQTKSVGTTLAPVQQIASSSPPPPAGASPNHTGLPDQLKAGLEALSGMDLSSVRVHRNSAKPAQLNALAYAQGTDIHLGPGQEKHLPHEAWHVVQQAQGRVKATTQMKTGVPINDDKVLEAEADAMGAKALQFKIGSNGNPTTANGVINPNCANPNHRPFQLQRDSDHLIEDGVTSFYRFNSTTTENYVYETRNAALRAATARLGSHGKQKVKRELTAPAARAGHYIVYAFDSTHDKVLVEHTGDDQAILWRYHGWRQVTGKGHKDSFNTVPHFHVATIPTLAGSNRQEYEASLGPTFPAYTSIGGDHHFYYIDPSSPSSGSGLTDISREEIDGS